MSNPNTPTPDLAAFLGMMGMVGAMGFSSLGSAYGLAKSGVAVTSIGIMHPDKLMKVTRRSSLLGCIIRIFV